PSFTSVNVRVAPVSVTPTTARSVTVPGLLTGAVTVLAAVPATPSLVAVIVAVPAATPVTRPVAKTVATVLLLVVQVTVRPVRTLPAASLVPAASCIVGPTVPPCPSLVAVIVAEPAATPVPRPLADTVATAALLVAQVTTRPLRAVPFASFGVAVNWVVAPTVTPAAVGLIVTEATGTLVTV